MKFVTPNGYNIIGTRYWNANGYAVAIVATAGAEGYPDWAAYIGGADPWREEDAYAWVAANGCKLTEKEAMFFFSDIILEGFHYRR